VVDQGERITKLEELSSLVCEEVDDNIGSVKPEYYDNLQVGKWYIVSDSSECRDDGVIATCVSNVFGSASFDFTKKEAEGSARDGLGGLEYGKWYQIPRYLIGKIHNGMIEIGKIYFVWDKSRDEGEMMFASSFVNGFVASINDINVRGVARSFANVEEVKLETLGVGHGFQY
jgi:hypothetical protein